MTVLTSQGLHVAVLASGSRGNCTWVGDEHHGVLIDCGISWRQIRHRLDALGLADAPVDAVLITHEHTDHVAAAGVIDRSLRRQGRAVPFLMTEGTSLRLSDKVRPAEVQVVQAGVPLSWASGWTLEPWRIPHDTADPVAWAIERDGARAAVVTDLGHAPRMVRHLLAGVDLAVLEFNHDEQMLMDGPYPWALKQRVRGRHGHLSNAVAASALADAVAGGRLKEVLLGHLSQENNTPDHAQAAADEAVRRSGAGVRLHVASQDEPSGPHPVTPPGAPSGQIALF